MHTHMFAYMHIYIYMYALLHSGGLCSFSILFDQSTEDQGDINIKQCTIK